MLSVKKKPIVTALCLLLIVLPSTKNLLLFVVLAGGFGVSLRVVTSNLPSSPDPPVSRWSGQDELQCSTLLN